MLMKPKTPLFLGLFLLLSACSGEEVPQEQSFQITTEKAEGSTPALTEEDRYFDQYGNVILEEIPRSAQEGIDLDLTEMSAAMVYGIVYQMMFFPEDYVGLTMRMEGDFFVWINPETGQEYYSTIVKDALACCQQGLEFRLADASYPDDYPEIESYITVVGELAIYEAHGVENIYLSNAVLEQEISPPS